MSGNIFEIEQRLLRILSEVEANEGELTEELAEQLAITEEDAKEKLNGYKRYITQIEEGDIVALKYERDRLDAKIKSKENTVERLKKVMIEALKLFGDTGKSGNKTLKTDLYNFFTKNTYTVEVDPLKCNLENKDALGFLKVKLPLVFTPKEYDAFIKYYEWYTTNDEPIEDELERNFINSIKTIVNCAYTVEPKKKDLTEFLKEQDELKEKLKTTPELFANAKPIEIPGVKLITNVSIQAK